MNLSTTQKVDAAMTISQAVAYLLKAGQDLANDDTDVSLYAVMRAEEAIKRVKDILGVPNK